MNDNLKANSSDMLTTQNNNLLFEHAALCNNNIFISLTEILEYSRD